ncbi:hypothetical protein Brms1b_004300 [Colletotrichum noveboracense]|nr:hypothetical protein Brms1b_004300 [Colletotrichum noveboracense]
MNSLNIITSRVSPPPSPVASRSNSLGSLGLTVQSDDNQHDGESAENQGDSHEGETFPLEKTAFEKNNDGHGMDLASEATPLIGESKDSSLRSTSWHSLPRRMAVSFINSIRWVLSTLAAPGVYLIACLYDDTGAFSPFYQLKKLFGFGGSSKKFGNDFTESSAMNEKSGRQGSAGKTQSAAARPKESGGSDISAQLKSPTSPAGALTRYPKTPAPPRPLIPRRQPSYLNIEPTDPKYQKTLILDLDETLIHSMSKGGRMSTGHMVEVRLNQTYVGAGGQTSIGPQHPILYWVNKRPHCDDFLRRVCKWYNLVVFTASVQEYADPVIDWLEAERKFFSARYYRQHCTFRQGAFIKDLSSVEPDLSKVMILDNSPLSYMFHQDNAIPIQGWINDPTDNDLLHLVPLLEGLQYVSDVRALLALRGGEDGQHMA